MSKTPEVIISFEKSWAQQRPDLDPSAVATELRVQQLARRHSELSASALTGFGLEWWAYDVLSELRRIGSPYECPVNQLSRIIPLTSGALTHRLDGLVARKLVTRGSDSHDRRKVLIKLTAAGKKLVDKAATARFDAAEKAFQPLSAAERTKLNTLFDKLLSSPVD